MQQSEGKKTCHRVANEHRDPSAASLLNAAADDLVIYWTESYKLLLNISISRPRCSPESKFSVSGRRVCTADGSS